MSAHHSTAARFALFEVQALVHWRPACWTEAETEEINKQRPCKLAEKTVVVSASTFGDKCQAGRPAGLIASRAALFVAQQARDNNL